ncbi:hypothetical protein F7725_028703 [Dissostichus mawsoni]|uniref:BZIP domain-containing protein n=1 Tax=Dissostichus mawsoni TaxID=36200 RepID=A0A7J5XGD9_DISMA|nr:hypothetical protein F7725_028703 [Dissostichus mawsoni]
MVMSMPLIVNCTHSLAVGCGNISVRGNTQKEAFVCRKIYMMAVTGDETETGTSGDLTACQLQNTGSSLPQGGRDQHSRIVKSANPSQKREHRLMKNREAARECRRKKKEYVKCLENRVAVLENQNKTLIEELRSLKDIYRHKVEDAAKRYRGRKKDYIEILLDRIDVLEEKNKKQSAELQRRKNDTAFNIPL